MRFGTARFLAILGLVGSIMPAAAEPAAPLVLGVHPYLPAKEVQLRFAPLAEYLSRTLQRPVVVRVGRDYEEHITAIGKDQVDIAFMGPAQYVRLVSSHGVKPLLARLEVKGKPVLEGMIVVRRDSPLQNLAGLKGKRFAFGDPESTMSHLLPQRLLEDAGVPQKNLAHYQFLGAHKNVALAVLAGDYDAGAVKSEIYQEYAGRGLRVLAALPAVSEHLFVTRASLPAPLVERTRRALLEIKTTPDGLASVQAINKDATSLVPVTDRDYDVLRRLLLAKRK